MDEEITDTPLLPGKPTQSALVKRICIDIEQQIQAAGSKTEAHRLSGEACRQFDGKCESTVVRSFLRKYVARVLETHWGGTL